MKNSQIFLTSFQVPFFFFPFLTFFPLSVIISHTVPENSDYAVDSLFLSEKLLNSYVVINKIYTELSKS